MTREEELDWLCRLRSEIYVYMPKEWLIPMDKALDMAIKVLEREPSGDLISRQAVLELIADYDLSMGQVVKGIHALPSVTPQEPKTGHWINGDRTKWKCSNCGYGVLDWNSTPYCPNCGAKMIEQKESEDDI